MSNQDGLLISQLAARLGINPRTIRYYEAIGLLARPRRGFNQYRQYDAEDQSRLGFILQARDLGFNLKEVAELLSLRDKKEIPCIDGRRLLENKLKEIDHQIQTLTTMRRRLVSLDKAAQTSKVVPPCLCGAIELHAIPTAVVADHTNCCSTLAAP